MSTRWKLDRRLREGFATRSRLQPLDLVARQLTHFTRLQRAERKTTKARTEEPPDRMPDRGADPLDEVRPPLGNDDLEPGVLLGALEDLDGLRRRHSILEPHAAAQLLERRLVGHAAHLREIGAGHLKARMHQTIRERAVVREEQRTLGVVVEPPDGKQPLIRIGQEVAHRRTTLRIVHRRHDAWRLVEQQVLPLAARRDELLVDHHEVLARLDLGAELTHHLVVHLHPARGDQLLRVTAGGDARVREELLQAFTHGLGPVVFASSSGLGSVKIDAAVLARASAVVMACSSSSSAFSDC